MGLQSLDWRSRAAAEAPHRDVFSAQPSIASSLIFCLSPSAELIDTSSTSMEHLCAIPSVLDNIIVPCLCTEEVPYDGLSFSTFPERCGYDLLGLRSGRDQHPKNETSAMLQSWLFFGMLSEVTGTTINADDFRRRNDTGDLVITTVLLDYHMYHWAARCKSNPSFREENRLKAIACLSEVSHYIQLPASPPVAHPIAQLIPDEVSISIRLVAEALAHFGRSIIWQDQLTSNPTFLFPISNFFSADCAKLPFFEPHIKSWCPSDRRRICTSGCGAAFVFMSQVLGPDPEKKHIECREHVCNACNVNEAYHGTKHTAECPGCTMLGPDEGMLQQFIRSDQIPLMKPTLLDNGTYKLEVISVEDTARFTVISHDWSAGLGSSAANKIPTCQLARIMESLQRVPATTKSLISQARSETAAADSELMKSRRPLSCAEPKALADRFRELSRIRRASLAASVAQRSKGLIDGQDSGTGHSSTEDNTSGHVDFGTTFWMDALCIPQEPYHRKKAISELNSVYKAAERVLVLDSRVSSVHSSEDPLVIFANIVMSGWMRRLWALPESLLAKHLHFALADGILEFVAYHLPRFPTCSDLLVNQLQSALPFWRASSEDQIKKLEDILMRERVAFCSLSRQEDEPVVLALLLDFQPQDMLQLLNAPGKERMRIFWSMTQKVPACILFWNGPKIAHSPYKWAPSTLRQYVSNSSELRDIGTGTITEHGLRIILPGWIFTMQSSPDDEILLWDKPSNAQFLVRRENQAPLVDRWIFTQTKEPQRYALICQSTPSQAAISSPAVLARVEREEQGVAYTTFVRSVRVSKVGNTEYEGPFFAFFTKGSKIFPIPVIVPEIRSGVPTWVIG